MQNPETPRKNVTGRKRYESAVLKGPNVWQHEWSRFISGVKMKDAGSKINLPTKMDWTAESKAEKSCFSYLFSSHSEKKAERAKKIRRREEDDRRERIKSNRKNQTSEYELDDRSKMQQALDRAQVAGMEMVGLNRKQKRSVLRLTRAEVKTDEGDLHTEAAPRRLKPHELMDPQCSWYQQGPYPLDLVAEKLVIKKAAKHAKQLGLRYNYLTVHPSWIASRAAKRLLNNIVPSGTKRIFEG